MIIIVNLGMTAIAAPADEDTHNPSKVINLVDYIGTDYRGAVDAGGKVLSPEEFQEMLDFTVAALDAMGRLELPADPARLQTLTAQLRELQSRIQAHAAPDEIATRSTALKAALIQAFGVATWPRLRPERAAGEKLYQENCAICHGLDGRADTVAGKALEPAPRSFVDPEVMEGMSPFKAFNVVTYGVEGTSMPSFQLLPDRDRWNLAFYLLGIRFSPEQAAAGARHSNGPVLGSLASLQSLSTSRDLDLLDAIQKQSGIQGDASSTVLAWLRRTAPYTTGGAPIETATELLELSLTRYRDGDPAGAYQAVVDSYLEGFEGAEASLGAIDRTIVGELERRYGAYRDAIRTRRPLEEVETHARNVTLMLDEADRLLKGGRSSAGLAFLQAFAIIAREGLEAAFLIAALLAFLGKSGHAAAKKYIHLGTGTALLAGIGTWWATLSLIRISGAQREMIEGFTTTLAAGILFYVSYWLFSKSEAQKWMAFLKEKLNRTLGGGSVMTLTLLAFLAVYREVFETVLFYQALYLSSEGHRGAFWSGLAVGTLVLVGIVLAIFRFGLKLPLQQFFRVTSSLMFLLSFVLAGQGIRALQLAGAISYTPVRFIEVPLLGIYPSLEPLLAQGAILAALLVYFVYLGMQRASQSGVKPGSAGGAAAT